MKEEEIIKLLKKEDEEFKKLSEEHRSLDQSLAELDRKAHLSSEEEIERRNMQKLKLIKKDRMAALIREYKKSHSN